jgi:hypothetical protein
MKLVTVYFRNGMEWWDDLSDETTKKIVNGLTEAGYGRIKVSTEKRTTILNIGDITYMTIHDSKPDAPFEPIITVG